MTLFHKLGLYAVKALPPERAHRAALTVLKIGVGPKHDNHYEVLRTNLAGLDLPNPVGLAAGFDKDAEVPHAMLGAGFGFVECGSVTPRPQAGNPKPRLFRLTKDEAVINRMGFNNLGLDGFAARLQAAHARPISGMIGANLGANKDSTDRAADYILGLRTLWGLADYFTVNISSPNTPGLRDLQSGDALEDLLAKIAEERGRLTGDQASPPVFLKLAPDLDFAQIERIVLQARTYGMSGLIISNTTISRPKGLKSQYKDETGGLSGKPLFRLSTRILSEFYTAVEGSLPLIGVGGIANGGDAYLKIRAGASAVQLYSAMIYKGPSLAVQICEDICARLKADGFSHIDEAVGTLQGNM
ncbi:MAG TPA: quinone-dependent dihydroorotate dehydrogenase [Hellea balneolensis]|uniref:Dihydroorotate dehydrogenase (quinone) n=1 Tax=Hellea balneolensis TaxID=287478 RepID=A0A7C3C996_9PROT|nr:quinone-dependent dihydroorotate dehydrogenase [Hellea balneolensis]